MPDTGKLLRAIWRGYPTCIFLIHTQSPHYNWRVRINTVPLSLSLCVYIFIHIHKYIHIYIHTCARTYAQSHTHALIHLYAKNSVVDYKLGKISSPDTFLTTHDGSSTSLDYLTYVDPKRGQKVVCVSGTGHNWHHCMQPQVRVARHSYIIICHMHT
jgi:hypothetical protein